MHIVTRGIVLRETNYKESDKILTVLTEDCGKCTVKVTGCRRKGSSLAASAQLLVYSDMVLAEYRDRLSLAEGSTIELFPEVRQDFERLALGSYFAQVTEAVSMEGEQESELLSLLLNCLFALNALDCPMIQIKSAFELRLLILAGYAPQLECCAKCGEQSPQNPCLHLRDGVLYCRQCWGDAEKEFSMPLTLGVLSALRYICNSPHRFLSFRLSGNSLKLLEKTTEAFLLTQLERGFSTLDFWKGHANGIQ